MSPISPVTANDVSLRLFEKPDLSGSFFGLQIVICIDVLGILTRRERKGSVSRAIAAAIRTRLKSDTRHGLAQNRETSVG
jgi:hypothetical protein